MNRKPGPFAVAIVAAGLLMVTGCASKQTTQTTRTQAPSRRNIAALGQVLVETQQDNLLYKKQRDMNRKTDVAAAASGAQLFAGRITDIRQSAGGAPLIYVSGSASPTFNRRGSTMVDVFRGDKPVGSYPMQVIRYGDQTVLQPLGPRHTFRHGDDIRIQPYNKKP